MPSVLPDQYRIAMWHDPRKDLDRTTRTIQEATGKRQPEAFLLAVSMQLHGSAIIAESLYRHEAATMVTHLQNAGYRAVSERC